MFKVGDIQEGGYVYLKSDKFTGAENEPKRKMKVVYVNEPHLYFVTEYEVNGHTVKECFKMLRYLKLEGFKPTSIIKVCPEAKREYKRPVICLDDGKIYNTVKEAGEKTGIPSKSINVCCSNGIKSTKGTHWAWFSDYEKRLKENPNAREEMLAEKEPKMPIRGGAKKKIVCVETGQIFNSVAEASKLFNTSSFNISHALTGDNKTAGGYQWQYLEDYKNKPLDPLDKMLWGKKWARTVICLETKEVFETSYKAAEAYGLSKSVISNCVNGRTQTAGGKHWMYYDIYKKRYEE